MKLTIFPFEKEVVYGEQIINAIEIDNEVLFTRIVQSINQLIHNIESYERISLFIEAEDIPFDKEVLLISDILNLPFDDRRFLTKLIKFIGDSLNIDEEKKEILDISLAKACQIILDIVTEFDFGIDYCTTIKIADFLKAMSLKINIDYRAKPIENLMTFLDLVSEFDLYKLIVFVNIKTYFDENQLDEFYKHAQYKKVNILLIDKKTNLITNKREKRWIIEKDYNDYIVEV